MAFSKTNLLFASSVIMILAACGGSGTQQQPIEPAGKQLSQLENEHQPIRAGYIDSVNTGLIEDEFRGSARRHLEKTVSGCSMSINHGSPGVRGRIIWNGVVGHDQVWVSGAHWATAVSFGCAVEIQGVQIPAGMYAFFTIPSRDSWTLILNSRYDQHLTDDYQEAEDIVRVTVQPTTPEQTVQRLIYSIVDQGDGIAEVALEWENVRVALPLKVVG